ncbi:MAG: hypothetical protein LBL95_02140 [Deltaproteobacteria bacterium]|jgi:hypothetical protein|nr:hypothetical protein [Deltaproteobacteria bacterium]
MVQFGKSKAKVLVWLLSGSRGGSARDAGLASLLVALWSALAARTRQVPGADWEILAIAALCRETAAPGPGQAGEGGGAQVIRLEPGDAVSPAPEATDAGDPGAGERGPKMGPRPAPAASMGPGQWLPRPLRPLGPRPGPGGSRWKAFCCPAQACGCLPGPCQDRWHPWPRTLRCPMARPPRRTC